MTSKQIIKGNTFRIIKVIRSVDGFSYNYSTFCNRTIDVHSVTQNFDMEVFAYNNSSK